MIKLAGGDQFSFSIFKKNVIKQPDPVRTVIDAARLLRESDQMNNRKWQHFSCLFFNEYRDTIMHYYGYEKYKYFASKEVVKYPRFFIGIMDVLLNCQILDCNKTELSNALFDVFCPTKHRSTIRKWFYESYPEYEEFLTQFKDSLSTLKINK